MIQVFVGCQPFGANPILDNMHRDRKRVFVDLRRWDIPVLEGEFERDEFDTPHAIYLVSAGADGTHQGSFRLLPTDRPHLMGELFADLCDDAVPAGPDIAEITRGCLSPSLRAAQRLRVRNSLISAAMQFAMSNGFRYFTGVADSGWLTQLLAMGWTCELLGTPKLIEGTTTGAIRIPVGPETVSHLKGAGTWIEPQLSFGGASSALAA
ncbi:acyl-homoserine-lactone synthase [Sphingomonas sp. MMS12-HWE2-04]|uniref:acyl-homoserine-lactone synthase n=1 Tax=Sphingomonas sp. MMS12-HWE2-04 TaxID=3234199 RepID=UPI00384D23B7